MPRPLKTHDLPTTYMTYSYKLLQISLHLVLDSARNSFTIEPLPTNQRNYAMTYKTTNQLQMAIFKARHLRVSVGASGDVSATIAQKVARDSCFKATFWGFDDAGNNIVVFKALA